MNDDIAVVDYYDAAVARADSRRAFENEAALNEHRTYQVDWLICPFYDDVLRWQSWSEVEQVGVR